MEKTKLQRAMDVLWGGEETRRELQGPDSESSRLLEGVARLVEEARHVDLRAIRTGDPEEDEDWQRYLDLMDRLKAEVSEREKAPEPLGRTTSALARLDPRGGVADETSSGPHCEIYTTRFDELKGLGRLSTVGSTAELTEDGSAAPVRRILSTDIGTEEADAIVEVLEELGGEIEVSPVILPSALQQAEALDAFVNEVGIRDYYKHLELLIDESLDLHRKGFYRRSLEVARRLHDAMLERPGERQPPFAANLNLLGVLYRMMGDNQEAHRHLVWSSRLSEELLKREDLDEGFRERGRYALAASMHNLGPVYLAMGQEVEAKRSYQRAMAIVRASRGTSHHLYAFGLIGLGELYSRWGDYPEAEALLRHAGDILGEDHPYFAASLNGLGVMYHGMGDHREAMRHLERAVELKIGLLGPEHPDTAISKHNLSLVYRATGNGAEAERLYEEALKVFRDRLGPDHPAFAAGRDDVLVQEVPLVYRAA